MFSQLAKQSARVLPVDLCTDHVHYVENHRSTVLRRNKNMAVPGGTVSFIQFFNHFLCWVASWSIKIFTVGKILLLSADHHAGWSLCKLWEHCFSVLHPLWTRICIIILDVIRTYKFVYIKDNVKCLIKCFCELVKQKWEKVSCFVGLKLLLLFTAIIFVFCLRSVDKLWKS